MDKEELEKIIFSLKIKLDYLTEEVNNDFYQNYDKGIKNEYGEKTRGTKNEIDAVKNQIIIYKAQLNKIKAQESFEYKEQKKEEERIMREEQEQQRLKRFKEVKEAYDNAYGHTFDKIKNKIFSTNCVPNWKEVKKYSEEELEYILKTLNGQTAVRKKIISKDEEKNLSFKEINEKIKKDNWDKFTKLLNSRSQLESTMEYELLENGRLNR